MGQPQVVVIHGTKRKDRPAPLILIRHFIELPNFHHLHHIGKKHGRRHEGANQKIGETVHKHSCISSRRMFFSSSRPKRRTKLPASV
jgi:hypothetical protein